MRGVPGVPECDTYVSKCDTPPGPVSVLTSAYQRLPALTTAPLTVSPCRGTMNYGNLPMYTHVNLPR